MINKSKIGASTSLSTNGERSRSIGILSLGCPRNLVDSESVLARLNLKGYSILDIKDTDVAIVNTCAFIKEAKQESIDAILDLIELKKEGRLKKIIVYGCLPQRYKDTLRKELPEVDAFVGKISFPAYHTNGIFHLTPPHYAYLKICEGCINSCSFCVIPKIKGKFTSLDIGHILHKIEAFDRDGVSEVNIIGQDITGYGIDLYGKRTLPELLQKIVKQAKHIGWIRLLYLYPDAVVAELLDLMKDEPKICRYIDLPIQHINDRLLKLMNRRVNKKVILELISKIRKNIPDVAIRTSLIVGFPSETDKEFKDLLKFIEDEKFERLGAFIYSREDETPAYNFKPQVPHKIKIGRLNAIMSAQQKISQEFNRKFLGRVIDVLIDEQGKDYYLGRSQIDAPQVDGLVYVRPAKGKLNIGDFVKVKIIDTLEYDLVGEVL